MLYAAELANESVTARVVVGHIDAEQRGTHSLREDAEEYLLQHVTLSKVPRYVLIVGALEMLQSLR